MGVRRKKKKNGININYVLIVILLLISVLLIIYYCFNRKDDFDISKILVNPNYEVVYELNGIPTINLDGDEIASINNEIITTISNNVNNDRFEYEYDVSADTLSLLLKRFIMVDNLEYIDFKTYVIDLETMHNMDYYEILDKYNISDESLEFFIKNKFLNYYADLSEKGYFKNKACDYNCFIFNCNFQDYMQDNHFYIKNNHLYMYKFFNIFTDYNYDDYFSYNSFVFEVK